MAIINKQWAGFEIECSGCTRLLSIFRLQDFDEDERLQWSSLSPSGSKASIT